MISVVTASGSKYLFDTENRRFRRVNPDAVKRGDEEWLEYYDISPLVVGHPVVILLEPLSSRGPDDNGVQNPDAVYTTRTTTPITSIEED